MWSSPSVGLRLPGACPRTSDCERHDPTPDPGGVKNSPQRACDIAYAVCRDETDMKGPGRHRVPAVAREPRAGPTGAGGPVYAEQSGARAEDCEKGPDRRSSRRDGRWNSDAGRAQKEPSRRRRHGNADPQTGACRSRLPSIQRNGTARAHPERSEKGGYGAAPRIQLPRQALPQPPQGEGRVSEPNTQLKDRRVANGARRKEHAIE